MYCRTLNSSTNEGEAMRLLEGTPTVAPVPKTVATSLGLRVGSDVVFLRRLRSTDGVAVAVLENYLPPEFSDITTEQLEKHGLYQILRSRGVTIRIAQQKIGARRAHKDESELLDLEKKGPS